MTAPRMSPEERARALWENEDAFERCDPNDSSGTVWIRVIADAIRAAEREAADEALGLLRQLEWSDRGRDAGGSETGERLCPMCGGVKPGTLVGARSPIAECEGHVAGCRLDAFLKSGGAR